jgi:hypothetical protein
MPLVFPPAPTTFFNRIREPHFVQQEDSCDDDLYLRHYRLERADNKKGRGVVSVEPMTTYSPMQSASPMIPPIVPPPMNSAMIPQMPPPNRVPPHRMPPMQMQPSPPSQSMQPSPENAAEQFRRVNKTLPDGVRYEPLDDETMRILQQKNPNFAEKMQQQQSQPPPHPPSSHQPQTSQQPFGESTPMIPSMPAPPAKSPMIPTPQVVSAAPVVSDDVLSKDAAEILQELAQGECNACAFYSHFAKKEESFHMLAKDSKARLEQYVALLKQHFGKVFACEEAADIKTDMEISEAVALAISEENKGLIALGNFLELAADSSAEKIAARIINKKIIGHQLLLAAQTMRKNEFTQLLLS